MELMSWVRSRACVATVVAAAAASTPGAMMTAQAAQASEAQPKFPRFSYYVQVMYWNRPGRRPEAVLPPAKTCAELRQMHYNGLLLTGWNPWVRGDGWFTDAYGLDSRRFMAVAGQHGLRVLVGTGFWGVKRDELKAHPEWLCVGTNGKSGQPCLNEPAVRKRMMEVLSRTAKRYEGEPAFWGIYFDEIGWRGGYCGRCVRKFRQWLRRHFTDEQLARRGIRDVSSVRPVLPAHPINPSRQKARFLWSASRRFANDNFLSFVQKLKSHWRKVAPGKLFIINNSLYCSSRFPVIYSLVRLGPLPDIQITDIYWHASPVQGYWFEIHNSVNPRVWQIADLHRNNPRTIRRDIYLAAMHVGGIMHFDYRDLYLGLVWDKKYKRMWGDGRGKTFNPNKNPARVQAVTEALGDVAKMEQCLSGAETDSPIAILRCEYNQMNGFESKYTTKDAEIYHFFVRNQIPVRALHIDGATAKQLAAYKVLVNTSECLADGDAATLRSWVERGGVLVSVGNEASLFDGYGVERKDYALNEVFGVQRNGTFPGRVRRIPLAALADKGGTPGAGEQIAVERDGKTLAVVNSLGKGFSMLFVSGEFSKGKDFDAAERNRTATWLNLMNRSYRDEGWLSVWRKAMDWAMRQAGEEYHILIEEAPRNVEANVRRQHRGNTERRILHLLNYGDEPVGPLTVRLRVPDGRRPARLFHAVTRGDIPHRLEGQYVRFEAPRFDIHRAVVLETAPAR